MTNNERAALEMLWWAACHVEVEPKANEYSEGEKIARTLSQELSEAERQMVRDALKYGGNTPAPIRCPYCGAEPGKAHTVDCAAFTASPGG